MWPAHSLMLGALLGALSLDAAAASAGLELRGICAIVVDPAAHRLERSAAESLRKELAARYGAAARIGSSAGCAPAIYLGGAAAAPGVGPSTNRIRSLGPDGFFIEADANRVSIASGGPAGTIYGVYELLRRVGLRYYPWRYGDGIVTFTPLADGVLQPFVESQRPYFDYRDVLTHLDRGRYGASIRELALGDLKFANDDPEFKSGGWVNWDHTAGWLVPVTRYGDREDLYAERSLSDRVRPLQTSRVAVCACQPEVARIAAERALEWIRRQPDPRYFAITDGDVERPRCPACASTDPLPDYYTDRNLRWVNAVAAEVGAMWPDKRFFTLAYLGTVKPPVGVKPAPNVIVVYAPWFWTSRTSSAVPLFHSLNIRAAEEFTEWTRRFPGQIGIYDYPGNWVGGVSGRIREYARAGVPWVYLNGPDGDLLQWVAVRMLWDPTQPLDPLVDEFMRAYYGPAAVVMRQHFDLVEQTVARRSRWSRDFFDDDVFAASVWRLIRQGEAIAAVSDPAERVRIRSGLAEMYEQLLSGLRSGDRMSNDRRQIVDGFVRLHGELARDIVAAGLGEPGERVHASQLRSTLQGLGLDLPAAGTDSDAWLAQAREHLLEPLPATGDYRQEPWAMALDRADEPGRWRIEPTDLASAPRVATGRGALGTLDGIAVTARLTGLPRGMRASREVPLGRVHLERRMDRPIRFRDRDSLYLHLASSGDVPVTVYVTVVGAGRLRADIALHAGEQIVRIALGNFSQLPPGARLISGLGIDLWPQSLIYPYPATRDVELVIASAQLRAEEPDPSWLPYRGRVVWLTSFRPNVSHGEKALERAAEVQGAPRSMLAHYGGSKAERFRSFTSHRVLSPIVGIAAGNAERGNAALFRDGMEQGTGVRLPVLDVEMARTHGPGNLAWVGLPAPGVLSESDLAQLPRGGVWVVAMHGRIAIAGSDPPATHDGIDRYLTTLGAGVGPTTPSGGGLRFATELYARDVPFLAPLPVCVGNEGPGGAEALTTALAAIRAAVLQGDRQLPDGVRVVAATSGSACRSLRRAMRDPFGSVVTTAVEASL